jgi:hypothetical protein
VGRYVSQEQVLVRLRGKVKVTDNPDEQPDRMPVMLLNRLISEAEGQVEMDLSPRYMAPFQRSDGRGFAALPERPTREVLRTLCELLAVIRVLETDFGRGSAADASKYADSTQKRYDFMLYGDETKGVPGLLSLRKDTYNQYRLPPLPGLKSNYHMGAVDTGFMGYVDRSDDVGEGSYPSHQINSPGENFWNGFIDSMEQDFTGDT